MKNVFAVFLTIQNFSPLGFLFKFFFFIGVGRFRIMGGGGGGKV